MRHSGSIGNLAKALAAAQAELRGAAKDKKNPHLRNTYADLASVWDACREPLTRHGLAVAQCPGFNDRGEEILETLLLHESGEWLASEIRLAYSADEKGRSVMQALGSAVSYARRYGLSSITGVYAEDDDGQGAGGLRRERSEAPRNGHGPDPEPEPAPAPAPPPIRLYSEWVGRRAEKMGISEYQLNNHLYKWACITEIEGAYLVPEPTPNATNADKFGAMKRIWDAHWKPIRDEARRYESSEAVRLANARKDRREAEAPAEVPERLPGKGDSYEGPEDDQGGPS